MNNPQARPRAIGIVRLAHVLRNGTPEIQDIAKRWGTYQRHTLEEFEKLLGWLKANPAAKTIDWKAEKQQRTVAKEKRLLAAMQSGKALRCSCGEMVTTSGLRQHVKINKAHRPPGREGHWEGCYFGNGLAREEVDRMVAEIREVNSERLRFRQTTFEETFES
jgi:hypothetical protein